MILNIVHTYKSKFQKRLKRVQDFANNV